MHSKSDVNKNHSQAVGSKEPEFVKMKTHGTSVYREVFKKADLVNVIPDVIVKELKKRTNIDFENDSYSQIRDAATTTVHNQMNAATSMDVDTHIMSIEKGKSYEDEDKPEEHHDSEQHGYQDEEGGPMWYKGKSAEGGWPTKGEPRVKGKFDGACRNCGKTDG